MAAFDAQWGGGDEVFEGPRTEADANKEALRVAEPAWRGLGLELRGGCGSEVALHPPPPPQFCLSGINKQKNAWRGWRATRPSGPVALQTPATKGLGSGP